MPDSILSKEAFILSKAEQEKALRRIATIKKYGLENKPTGEKFCALLDLIADLTPRPYTASDIDSAPNGLYLMGSRYNWESASFSLDVAKKCLASPSGYWRLAYGPYPAPPESAYPLKEKND